MVRHLAQPRATRHANEQPVVRESDSQDEERGKTDREVGRGGGGRTEGRRRKGPHKFLSPLYLMASEVLATSASPSRQRPTLEVPPFKPFISCKAWPGPSILQSREPCLPAYPVSRPYRGCGTGGLGKSQSLGARTPKEQYPRAGEVPILLPQSFCFPL